MSTPGDTVLDVALSISGSRFDRIGKKLAGGVDLDPAEQADLEAVFGEYDAARQVVQDRLSRLGHPPATSRLKTTTTLIDKLQREPLSIRGIDDLAGVRVVIDGGRWKQDRARDQIVTLFEGETKTPKVHDRRTASSHGYRAVHVIVYVDRIPVEIQIRTELQHLWAEIVEKLGDIWGRGLRYGLGPDEPQAVVAEEITRGLMFDSILKLGEQIDEFESNAYGLSQADHRLRELEVSAGSRLRNRAEVQELRAEISQTHERLVTVEESYRRRLRLILEMCAQLEAS